MPPHSNAWAKQKLLFEVEKSVALYGGGVNYCIGNGGKRLQGLAQAGISNYLGFPMFGLRFKRISDHGMNPNLPFKSIALFRATKWVRRSDIVLVDHPQYGSLVRKVSAVSMNGRVGLRGISRSENSARKLGNVDRDRVYGKIVLSLNWARFLPYFGPQPAMAEDEEEGRLDAASDTAPNEGASS